MSSSILNIFLESEALLEGHFLLTSGKHSDRYVQCAKILKDPAKTELVCKALVKQLDGKEIDVVIAPAVGGILVSYELGRQLSKPALFTERVEGKMELRRTFEIHPGEKVLVAEDVITTGGSVQEVVDLVEANGGEVVAVACMVDRSGGKADFGGKLISALQLDVKAYDADTCPICKESGTQPVKPGSRGLAK